MKKILFIASHRKDRSPSQRFRYEQYLGFLQNNGFGCEISFLISEKDDQFFYRPGNAFKKLIVIFKSIIKRFKDVRRAKNFDIVFIQREAFMTGSAFFEKRFSKKTKVVFDFDDSIWLLDTSAANQKWEWLKDDKKTSRIISYSNLVFAGNQYLADYARKFNKNVTIIPTTIDTNEYKRISLPGNGKVCIGWSGSITTIKHFEYALPFLKRLKKKYGEKISIRVIGDADYRNEELDITGIGWNKKDELKELSSFDIGIMPLPDDEWAKGKCGLKGLQYMALEIPTIMSPVGVNTEIISDGNNGFLATTEDEWFDKLFALIESAELRKQLGSAARKTVEDRYSVESQKNNYLNHFHELLKQ